MGTLDQLESFLQDLLERPAWLLGSRHLRPLDLVSALTRELEGKVVSYRDGLAVASDYEIFVSYADLQYLAPFRPELEQELTAYIRRLAEERNLHLSNPPRVRIRPDPGLGPTQVIVSGIQPAPARAALPNGRLGAAPTAKAATGQRRQSNGSSSFPRIDRSRAGFTSLVLLGADGRELRRYALSLPSTTLGRRSDNDISFAGDSNVSRHHARIDAEGSQFYLSDLGSKNGTHVNGQRVEPRCTLHSGDIVEVGLQRLRFDHEKA